ncbi:MAG: ATP-binding protein, partial [Mycobacterium sp.]
LGMTAEELGQVFERFWRADPSRKRTIGGTGLGLSIAREDTVLHGGWLQVWSTPGEGSCFRLTLPRSSGGTIVVSPLPLPPTDVLDEVSLNGDLVAEQDAPPKEADDA